MLAAILLGGQVVIHLLRGKIYRRNTIDQMAVAGPESLLIALIPIVLIQLRHLLPHKPRQFRILLKLLKLQL